MSPQGRGWECSVDRWVLLLQAGGYEAKIAFVLPILRVLPSGRNEALCYVEQASA